MGKINDTIDLVKTGLDAQIALATAEQKEKLADAKIALADLKTILADLKIANDELRRQEDVRSKVTPHKGCYAWEVGDGKIYAICSNCWEAEGKTISLNNSAAGAPDCPRCKNWYDVDESGFDNFN